MTFDAKAIANEVLGKCKDHLTQMHESYGQHMCFALRVCFTLLTAGLLLLIHAIVPAWFQCSASSRIFRLADEIRARQAKCEGAHTSAAHDL